MIKYKQEKIEQLQDERSKLKSRTDLTKEQLIEKDNELVMQIKKLMNRGRERCKYMKK